MASGNVVANDGSSPGREDQLHTIARSRDPVSSDPAALPQDLVIQISHYLEPWDVVRFRRVSRRWNQTFADPYLLQRILRQNLRTAREVRGLVERNDFEALATDSQSLRTLFDRLACRYYHLANAKPYSVSSFKTADDTVRGPILYPVGAWDYHRSRERSIIPGLERGTFDHAFWSYDDGLLVYPSKAHECLVVTALETGATVEVPFDTTSKVIRNFRIAGSVLIIEWAEHKAFHALNDSESVHRHFASLYRIIDQDGLPSVSFHSEFKLHFLGLPLTERDRFYSTHTQTHYAVYFWQPNRSMYTGDEENPIESLLIFDISSSSSYLPSSDPTGLSAPSSTSSSGPKSIARLSFRDLEFYGVRQRSTPALTKLSLDSASGVLAILETQNQYTPGYFDPGEPNTQTSTTLIPFLSYGPHQHIPHPLSYSHPLYTGNSTLDSHSSSPSEPPNHNLSSSSPSTFETWFTLHDRPAHLSFTITRTLFKSSFSSDPTTTTNNNNNNNNYTLIQIHTPSSSKSLSAPNTALLLAGEKAKLAGDERWIIGEGEGGGIHVLRFSW